MAVFGPPFFFVQAADILDGMEKERASPAELRKQAKILWKGGFAAEAAARARQAINADPEPTAKAFLLLAVMHFHQFEFDKSVAVLSDALECHPDHPELLNNLAASLVRARRYDEARPILEKLLALGFSDRQTYAALAHALSETGDLIRARLFGSFALDFQDKITIGSRGRVALNPIPEVAGKKKIIAFSLFGSRPRYLRGALLNVLEARRLYPDWTCRFYVDPSVDEQFLDVIERGGAELVRDELASEDRRTRLTRRFLVNDDSRVGHFLVRDCDSVVGEREVRAVDDWLASGLPFHAIRDWYTHTDVMLAGLWGGIAGVYPDMAGAIARYATRNPATTNWDQEFLREQIWPDIRDSILVHDRLFKGHAVRAFPGTAPPGDEHVGQNEYARGKTRRGELLSAYADRIPALGISVTPLRVKFEKRF